MEDPTKQLLKSAQEGAEGSGSSVGAQLVAKLSEGNADPKLVTEEIRQKMVRGGRGSKGEPSEIKDSIVKAQEDAVRIDNTLSKLKNEKEGLLRTIADFRIKEKQLVETGRKEEVEAIRKAIANAQNEVDKINGVVPESVALDDHKKIQSIVSEWYAEKQQAKEAAEKIRQAESKLETTPDDGRALGDAIRGKTEKAEAEEQLAEAEREAELILKNKTPNPARDEGVHHTNEETVEERNFLNRRRSERVAPGVFGHKKETEEMQNEMDELATDVSEAPVQQQSEPATINETALEEKIVSIEQSIASSSKLDTIHDEAPLSLAYNAAKERILKENETKRNVEPETPKQEQETPIIFYNVEEKRTEVKFLPDPETDDDLLPIIMEHTETTVATPQVSRKVLGLSAFIKKIFNFFSSITAKSEVHPKDMLTTTSELVDAKEEPAPQITSEEIPEKIISTDEFLEKPLFTEFETTEQPSANIDEEKKKPEESPVAVKAEPEYKEVSPAASITQEILPEELNETLVVEYVPPMPQEITPGNTTELTQLEVQAEEVLRNDMDEIIGYKKGPFGILGHTNGMESKNWTDPQVGLSGKTVGDILKATPSTSLAKGGQSSYGIENADLVDKIKKYLTNASQVSGLNLEASSGSLLADFVRRAAIAKLSK